MAASNSVDGDINLISLFCDKRSFLISHRKRKINVGWHKS